MDKIVRILEIKDVARHVKSFKVEKPDGYTFVPGQATEVSVNEDGWKEEKRPFTFTSLAEDPYLEFTIKGYTDHDGVTNKLHQLQEGDTLIIRDVWGAIAYKGTGCFIAGGAGITPFIAILRRLHKDGRAAGNKLFFANKTAADIIYEGELAAILGKNTIHVLTEGSHPNYLHGYINEDLLTEQIKDFNIPFYVCGPDKMISDINSILLKHGATAENVVFEK